jgi:thymidylate kinase
MTKNSNKGSLIVFEGVDSSGKTTMSKMLCDYFSRCNRQTVYRKNSPQIPFEPTERLLEGYQEYLGCISTSMPEIKSMIDNGVHVVHDRYIDSIEVFRECIIRNLDYEICEKCKKETTDLKSRLEIIKPDISFYLLVDFMEALKRKETKSKVDKIMLSDERIFNTTSKMFEELAKQNSGILIDTTNKSINDVFGLVQEKVKELVV